MGILQRPDELVAVLIAFLIGITVHECAHAWTALRLGDDTAQRLGRVTLNPLAHLDPIGTIGLLLIIVFGFGIGWGRPVPVNPARLRWHQRGMALVALAGPVSNILLALLGALVLRFGVSLPTFAALVLHAFIQVNLLLASFNLIPIPPLDGLKILLGILPRFWYLQLAALERYGLAILILLIAFGSFGGSSILAAMYLPVFRTLASVFTLVTGQPML